MDSGKTPRGEKRRTFMSAAAIVLAIMVLAPPIVYAAAQKVNIVKSIPLPIKKGSTVGVSNLRGATTATQNHGSIPGETTPKTVNSSIFSGGEGFWGVAICGAGEGPEPGDDSQDNQVFVPATDVTARTENVISSIVIGSPDAAVVTIAAPDLPSGENPILIYRTSANQPSQAIELPTGLRVSPSSIRIRCQAGGTLPSNPATVGVLGH